MSRVSNRLVAKILILLEWYSYSWVGTDSQLVVSTEMLIHRATLPALNICNCFGFNGFRVNVFRLAFATNDNSAV